MGGRIGMAILCCCLGAPARPLQPQDGEKLHSSKALAANPQVSVSQHLKNEIERAKQMLQEGSKDDAIRLLREILQKESDNADAHLLLGTALALVPERSEALKELHKAVDLKPKSAQAHFALGTAQARFADFDGARATFERSIQLDPNFADAHVAFAMMLAQKKEFAPARDHLLRAIKIQGSTPAAANTHFLLSEIYSEQGELESALQQLSIATTLRPNFTEAYLEEGFIRQIHRRDTAKTIQAFQKAAELSPQNFDAQYQLGAAYLRAGEAAQAIVHLQKALEVKPAERPVVFQLCRAFREAGKPAEAKACWQRLSTIVRTEQSVSDNTVAAAKLNNEGVELEKAGNFAAALEKYQKAVELYPARTVFKRNLALLLCRLGRWDEGIALLKEVLKEDPDDAKATKALYIALENVRRRGTTGISGSEARAESK